MNRKSNTFSFLMGILAIIAIVFACSTEKNTFINRTYHSTTARFNGYFNAKELIRIGLEDYRRNYREDFNSILPIELYPNEEDVTDFYPIVDTAISKCQEVITKHSMPTASKPSQKKTEHANWIDQNWIMIGKANYIKKEYEKALDNFEYVRKFYKSRSSTYTGQLWEARTQMELGDLTEAARTFQKLEQRKQNRIAEQDGEKSKFKIFKRSKAKSESGKAPPMPKDFEFELAKAKAMLAIRNENYKRAVDQLKMALEEARKKEDEARISFIIGQLLQKSGNPEAREFYTQTIRKNAPFEMSFNARVNRAVVSDLSQNEMIEELKDMAEEERYMEFRDQIYFAMAEIELSRNDRAQAKTYLSKSVFFSLNNPRQKGVSYEKLGDMSFEDKDFLAAQKYFDSSAQVIPESYENAELIKTKAEKLADLVEDMDLIAFEDSVQRIARMDEKTRKKFLKDVIAQLKKEEEERKRREAERAEKMRELQQSYAEQNQSRGNKWYFSNTKAMQEGVEEFRRVWGQRENEDYWRLSKTPRHVSQPIAQSDTAAADTLQPSEEEELTADDLTPEILIEDVPLSDSAMAVSNERLLEALYSSGMIYKQQLNEAELGARQFDRVVDHGVENKHNVLSAFELYKIYDEKNNSSKKKEYADYIMENYPDSDYANYLEDPDYFVKKKERDALARKEYIRSVERFERGLYYPVILKADKVLDNEKDNVFRKEYFLLKAMAMGRVNPDKTTLIPVLEQAIAEFPDTRVAERSQELLDLIKNGVPDFEPFNTTSGDLFDYSEKGPLFVLVQLDSKKQPTNGALKKISNFNREFFSRNRLNTQPQIYNKEITLIQVKEFPSAGAAEGYIKDYKKTKKHLGDLRKNDIYIISKDNLKVLLQEQALDAYQLFYRNNF